MMRDSFPIDTPPPAETLCLRSKSDIESSPSGSDGDEQKAIYPSGASLFNKRHFLEIKDRSQSQERRRDKRHKNIPRLDTRTRIDHSIIEKTENGSRPLTQTGIWDGATFLGHVRPHDFSTGLREQPDETRSSRRSSV